MAAVADISATTTNPGDDGFKQMKKMLEQMQGTIEAMQMEYANMEKAIRLEIEHLRSDKLEQDIQIEK